MDFVHLHLHTEYSLLDGECRISKLPAAVKALGQKAVAITDHGVLYGAVDFFKACKKEDIKPIIGCEVYVSPRSRDDKIFQVDSSPYHLVLLVKNEIGYKNLVKIVSDGFTHGFYQKPRTDFYNLEMYSEGLVALSGCLSGIISKKILEDDYDTARNNALKCKEIFGNDFYIELQRHNIEGQAKINHVLMHLGRELEIPFIATNDVHYIEKEDAVTQELLMAISTQNTLGDKEFAMEGEEFYLKSSKEMTELFKDIPQAIENTIKIADMCNFEFDFKTIHLPVFTPPNGFTQKEYLKNLCLVGLEERRLKFNINNIGIYEKRLENELEVIHTMGFDDYFLIVWDFVAYAASRNIPVGPGRGSAVGSLTAYTLGITDVDPIKYDLLFERFLNIQRASMPDIDIDFSDERRGEVINYVCDKYGHDHVSQIITFGTLACRGAIRDVGRALGMSYARVDEIAKLAPRYSSSTIDDALNQNPQLKKMYGEYADVKKLLDFARKMEGRPRNSSTHATGIVITDRPTLEYIPVSVNDNTIVTQFTMKTVADLGLLKIDFLGLRFLTIINEANNMIRRHTQDFDIQTVPLDDTKTYTLLSKGQSIGLFQLESEGMRDLLNRLQPACFEDIINVISLYRPGPAQFIEVFLKNRRDISTINYETPLMAEILEPTYGCMIYQEQVMQICRKLAGFSYGEADVVRDAMAKKKHDVMETERVKFINGCIQKNSISAETANKIFNDIASFASYAFNKSHAAAYAVVSYRTAYLKSIYPAEYMCALLNSVMGDSRKVNEYIAECKVLGFKTLCPDINESGSMFKVVGENIRFGLSAIKNIGNSFAKFIVDERKLNGLYKNMEDFICRVSSRGNAKMFETLVLCGALDGFGIYRSKMYAVIEKTLNTLNGMKSELLAGQINIFETMGDEDNSIISIDYPPINEYPAQDKLLFEKSFTGVYFSGHPLEFYKEFAKKSKSVLIKDLYNRLKSGIIKDGTIVNLTVQIKQKRAKMTKTNKLMAYLIAEDLSDETEIVVFPASLDKYGDMLEEGKVYLITGKAEISDSLKEEENDVLKILMMSAASAKPDFDSAISDLYFKINNENKNYLNLALEKLKYNRGQSDVYIYFENDKRLVRSKDIKCKITPALIDELNKILGDACVAQKKRTGN